MDRCVLRETVLEINWRQKFEVELEIFNDWVWSLLLSVVIDRCGGIKVEGNEDNLKLNV